MFQSLPKNTGSRGEALPSTGGFRPTRTSCGVVPATVALALTMLAGVSEVAFPQSGSAGPGESVSPASIHRINGSIPAKVFRYAERLLTDGDLDGDGLLDRREWTRQWGFILTDTNRDGRVGLDELVQRISQYGRQRMIRLIPPPATADEFQGPLLRPTTETDAPPAPGVDDDLSTDSQAVGEETPRHNTRYHVPRGRLQQGLPVWFTSRDTDGDGQLTMAEYAPNPTADALAGFAAYDTNRDGVITQSEYVRAARPGME